MIGGKDICPKHGKSLEYFSEQENGCVFDENFAYTLAPKFTIETRLLGWILQ